MKISATPLNPVTPACPARPAAASDQPNKILDLNQFSAVDLASQDASKTETTTSNLANPSVKRSMKVRLKVGFDKSKRVKDELLSGLGPLTSSSSTGINADDFVPPVDSHDNRFGSASTILCDMTSIFVPGNQLVSPLNESLLCLPKVERNRSASIFVNVSSSVLREVKQMEGKEVSSQGKSKSVVGTKNKNCPGAEGDKATFSEKDAKTESLDRKQGLNNDFKVKLSSGSTSKTNQAAARKVIPVKKRETQRELIEDKLFSPDFTSKELDGSYEQKHVKKLSLDSEGSGGIKGNVVCSVYRNDPDVFNHETCRFEEKDSPTAIKHEQHEAKDSQSVEKWPSARNIKLMGVPKVRISKENSMSSISGAEKDKKSGLKDIVRVRNSYKEILESSVDDHIQTQPSELPTGNEAVKEQVEKNDLSVPFLQQAVGGSEVPSDHWVLCDRCEKWRLLPIGIDPENLPDKWQCSMSTWLPGKNYCDIIQDETTRAVQEMNLHILSQNQNSLQVNKVHADHMNSNVNSEIMPSRLKKNNLRPEVSNPSLIETSHSSMEFRHKRKSSSHANQPLWEKDKKPVDAGRHVAKVNGGDPMTKKLKVKTEFDGYETVTLNTIKTESERDVEKESEQLYSSHGGRWPRERLVVTVKKEAECTRSSLQSILTDKKLEMHAKKRKLKDWQESQHYSNILESSEDRIGSRNEKRLKTSNIEVKDRGKTMKIKLSASKENLVDTSHEKDTYIEKVAPKDLESKRIFLAATSSSSKVSGSCRRASFQERKGSPVGSVSSSPIISLNLGKLSPAGRTITRKAHAESGTGIEIPRKDICGSQRSGGKVDPKHKEASKFRNSLRMKHDTEIVPRKICMKGIGIGSMIPQSSGKGSLPMSKDKDERPTVQKIKLKAPDSLPAQEPFPNKIRKVEVDVEVVGDVRRKCLIDSGVGKKIPRKRTSESLGDEKPTLLTEHTECEFKLGETNIVEMTSTVKNDLRKAFVGDISKRRDLNEVEPKAEASPSSAAKQSESAIVCHPPSRSSETTSLDVSGQNESKIMKHPGDAANQNAKTLVTDSGTMKDLGVIHSLKEHASSQAALTAFKRAEESKDYADRLKISGFDYECTNAFLDCALRFLYAASLLEACTTDFSKSKGVDPIYVYSTSARLSKVCAQEFEKQKEMASTALAYKCMEVACMRIVYCKSLVTRQDLQTSMQMVTQGESPSSSASDVDNLNNQAMADKTILSKIVAHPGNHSVARNQANFTRLFDFTSDVSLAMEASMKSQNAYKAVSSVPPEVQKKELIASIKRVVDFSFQDVKEVVLLVQNAREAINREGFKGINRQ
uniref:cysteine-tryptophan domain-containing zinc finger protein 3-like n=1 Tax=Erigeron canadensis TaxID=72917 RepID=UPI001CB95179|nr:cysteine-tryptophan domain-containing zinc finger protein 3-like [Erigeron canadensis]